MSVQSQHSGLRDVPYPVTASEISDRCTTESVFHPAVEIIVLRVGGEVDLRTVPIIQAAVDDALDQYPDHVIVDLARMTFCSMRGLDLFTRTRSAAAEKAIGYAVTGVLPQVERIWALCWCGDLPIRYRTTAAAIIAIHAHRLG